MTPEFNANTYASQIRKARTPETVEAIFADIAQQPANHQTLAINAIETQVVSEWKRGMATGAELAQMKAVIDLLDATKNTPQGRLLLASLEREVGSVAEGQAQSLVFLKISQSKGDAADPMVKAVVAEAAKLSDEDYNSPLGVLKLMVNVAAAQAPAAPANPFRQTPKP